MPCFLLSIPSLDKLLISAENMICISLLPLAVSHQYCVPLFLLVGHVLPEGKIDGIIIIFRVYKIFSYELFEWKDIWNVLMTRSDM